MAVRTTSAAVGLIIEVDSDINLTSFIETASNLVDRACVSDDSEYTSADLELIERWLAAHFYAVRDPRATSEKAGPVGVNYESRVDLGFNVTRYGQQALLLDTEGGLASLQAQLANGVRRKAGRVTWLGTKDSTPTL